MGKFTVTHEINCNAETFWKVFFEKEYQRAAVPAGAALPRVFDRRARSKPTQTITRKVAGQPKMDLPGPVAKLLGSNFRFTEEGTLDKATQACGGSR
ncbi:MAG: DUF2505 family protein [Candidatus Nanopelagicales bacterium]